jgi:hypothetical protein
MTYFWVLYSDWRSVIRFFLCPLHKGTIIMSSSLYLTKVLYCKSTYLYEAIRLLSANI